MAVLNALTSFMHIPHGFTNQTLRHQVADLLGSEPAYGPAQMSYDLRRLRLKGFIWRIPNSYRYQLTTYGRQVALLFSKVAARVFRPALAALDPVQPLSTPVAEALQQLEQAIADLVNEAHLQPALA